MFYIVPAILHTQCSCAAIYVYKETAPEGVQSATAPGIALPPEKGALITIGAKGLPVLYETEIRVGEPHEAHVNTDCASTN